MGGLSTGTLLARALIDTLRLSGALYPALLGFVATGALAVMASVIPEPAGGLLAFLILVLGGTYFTLQSYGFALAAKRGEFPPKKIEQMQDLHRQILAVWLGYAGWWILFASVLAAVNYALKIADQNISWLVSFLPEVGIWRGLGVLFLLLLIRGMFFWLFETSNAFLGVSKMSGGRDVLFARSFVHGRRLTLFFSLLIAALPLLVAGGLFQVFDLFTINGLGLNFVLSLPLTVAGFLGLILGYCFVLSVFIRTHAFLDAFDGLDQE